MTPEELVEKVARALCLRDACPMTANNGWPGAPGVPENPERDGWHELKVRNSPDRYNRWWSADGQCWTDAMGFPPIEHIAKTYEYVHPFFSPAEVAARVAEAREEGRLSATLDAPAQPIDDPQWDATDAAHPAWWRGNDHGVAAVVQIINDTLDGKPAGTYGSADLTSAIRRVAEARAEGMREAADICDELNEHTPGICAAAIRAAAGEGKP